MSIKTQQSLTTLFKAAVREYSPTDVLIALDAAVKNRSEYSQLANGICDTLMNLDSPKAQKWRDRILLRDNAF